jgi:hypothetical protein
LVLEFDSRFASKDSDKATQIEPEPLVKSLVPTARLELAQLSPLPPQDSVSTNSTTTACFTVCQHEESPKTDNLDFSPKNNPNQGEPELNSMLSQG